MWTYIARRLMWLPFLLFFVSLLTFSLGRFAPGDPVRIIMGNRYDPDRAALIRKDLGLDRPFFVQYGDYMWGFIRGDFGESLRFRGQPIRGILLPKMWVSAQLSLAALVISVGVGVPLGFFVAHRQGRLEDASVVSISLILYSIPIMVTVPVLQRFLCLNLDLIPCSGWGGLFDPRIIVPAFTMGVPGIAFFTRLMRASTLDVMGQDFIRTAHSKGLSALTIDTRHVLRNAAIPIITILAFSLAGLVGGALITETLLGIPGMGRFVVDSIFNRDYPVIMAVTLLAATAFVLANLLADVTYAIVDPRIRYR